MNKYKDEFIHWDVSNEMLRFDFYEQRLGPNAILHFYEIANMPDPSAALFMIEFNVIESDVNSTIDTFLRLVSTWVKIQFWTLNHVLDFIFNKKVHETLETSQGLNEILTSLTVTMQTTITYMVNFSFLCLRYQIYCVSIYFDFEIRITAF